MSRPIIRTLFLLAMLASAASAQSTDARIANFSRQMAGKLQPNRVPSVGERLGAALDQTRTDLGKIASRLRQGDHSIDVPAALREERGKLAVLDEAYETEFASVESKLRRAHLPAGMLSEKLAAWHNFTANYRQRMAASQASFDRVSRDAAAHDASWVQGEIAKLAAGLGSSPTPRLSSVVDRGAPKQIQPRTAPVANLPPQGNDPPTPADLVASDAVVLTPDIVAKAASLGNSPAAIFAYVYNTIQFVPYYMLDQNSESVLWSGNGNDADQATLLIALLRASGVPARYAEGYITVPAADAINWMGVKDQATAGVFLNMNTIATNQGSSFSVLHVWVEAWLNTPRGNTWVPMTPSIKRQTFQPGLTLAEPVFNRTQFLGSVQPLVASQVYASQLLSAFQQAYPGRDFSAMPYTGTIKPVAGDVLPAFPYAPTQVVSRGASLQGADQTMGIRMGINNKLYFSHTLSMPQVSTQSVTIGFTAASPAYQTIIDSFGGLANTPAGMVDLLPQLLVNEQVAATGSVPMAYGAELEIVVGHFPAYSTSPSQTYQHYVTVGENVALTLGYNQISDGLIASRIDGMLSAMSTATPDFVTRELLSLGGIRYYQRVEIEKQRVFVPLQIVPVLPFPEECATSASVKVVNLFDRPFLVTPGDLTIDAQAAVVRGFDLNAGGAEALSVPGDLNVSRAAEAASSGLENQVWEELVLIPAISTIKALQINTQAGIPLLAIDSSNVSLLSTVQAPPDIIQTLTSDIAGGVTVTISEKPTVFGVWTGFGWIEDGNDSFEYAIEQTNTPVDGGSTGGNQGQPMPPTGDPGPTGNQTPTNGTPCSDPVSVSNGNMYHQQTDLFISSRSPAIMIQRTYNSLAAAKNGPFGFGWTHNYLMSLNYTPAAITFTNESGGVFTFALQNGSYVSPAGLDLTLTKTTQGYSLRSTHGMVWRFSFAGVLQSITDRNQNATTLTYSGGLLSSITDALGRAVTLSYNADLRIAEIKDFTGRTVTYTYDALGDLASQADALGNVTRYAYYTAAPFTHLLQTVTKPAGNSTSFEYYVNGQAARVSDSAGRNMRFFYLPLANQTMFIDPRGYTSSFYYNALGNVTRLVRADGNYVDYTYTADAKPSALTDADGFTTSYTYDTSGNPTSVTDPLGNVTTLSYDPTFNQVTSVTAPTGTVTELQYDASGDLTGVTEPLGMKSQYTYNSFGQVLTATDGEGNTTSFAYDGSGNIASATNPVKNATEYHYDNLRRLTSMIDALGNQSSVQWDALNRLTNLANPLHASLSFAYDGNSNLAKATDANGNTTLFSHDALDNLTQVKDARGGIAQYSYATPNCGCMTDTELTGFRDAAGVSQSQAYDSNQWLTQTVDAAGDATTLAYDARGNLVAKTDANGNTIQYKYDADGRLLGKSFPDGTSSHFTFDANGNLISAANAHTTVTFAYDALNRPVTVTDSRFGQKVTYAYDHDNRRTSLMDPTGGVTKYSYDAASRVTSIKNPTGGSAEFSYDAAGRRTELKYSNGLTTSYHYNAANQPIAVKTSGAGPQFSYTYDPNGNPTAATDASGTHAYQFDELNRITAATHQGPTTESYTYDGAGNRLTSASGAYEYDATARLTAGEGFYFTYDKNGNLISRIGSSGTTTYTYDFENQLTAIKFPNGSSATYEYDALGRRIQKDVNGTITAYLYDASHILLEMNHSGAMQARLTHGPATDQMLTMERGGQTYFYHSSAIGSVASLTNSSGKPVCNYTYDSFGRTQNCAAVANPFAFAGREYDSESGLYYMRARYYDPATGRFITPDPLNLTGRLMLAQFGQASALGVQGTPQQLNSYGYAINNPLVFVDPSGLNCGPLFPNPVKKIADQWFTETINGTQYVYGPTATGTQLIATAPASYIVGANNSIWAIVSPSGQLYGFGATSRSSIGLQPDQINSAELSMSGQIQGMIDSLQANAPGNNNQPSIGQYLNPVPTLQQAASDLVNTFVTQPAQAIQQNYNEAVGCP